VVRIRQTRNSPVRGKLAYWIAAGALCFWPVPALRAQQGKPSEYQVKAAYLYNFGKFVNWPAEYKSDGDSFPICVLGKDPFGAVLDTTLANQSIGGKNAIPKRIAKPEDASGCRVLFISSSEDRQLKDILAALDKTGVLTVSDMAEFSQHGGMIEFVLEGDRVRFAVNLSNAEDAGLSLSSELLKVAVTVRRNPRPSGDGD
jgi:hypothetical protein